MTDLQAAAWSGRVAIRELLKPPKFNGRIGNIILSVIENPYEQLINAHNRNVTFTRKGGIGGQNLTRSSERADKTLPLFKGFTFTAEATSTGRGVIGQIQAELYYFPVSLKRNYVSSSRQPYKDVTNAAGSSVKRVVSKPEIASEQSFIELADTSRLIAYSVLRSNIKRPFSQPFHS